MLCSTLLSSLPISAAFAGQMRYGRLSLLKEAAVHAKRVV